MALLYADTTYGRVRGLPALRCPEHTVFRGIPFAQPPTGKLRFAAPRKPSAWSGERLCGAFSPACIQDTGHPKGPELVSEDCLYLNVYTPAERPDEKRPVLFWIYGGGFGGGYSGDPEFDGNAMCAKGAVVVTLNYRCGVFGFFSLPELEEANGYAGNVGLLDQIAALEWVRDNIAAFGGDPQRVTVFGQSAGGMSTRMLLTSPAAKGLFSRAVIESGGGLNEADLVRPRPEFTKMCQDAMKQAGLSFRDLMEKDAMEIHERMNRAVREIATAPEINYFQPFVDGLVLTDVPGILVKQGRYMDLPIINMTVAGDAGMFSRKIRGQLEEIVREELSEGVSADGERSGGNWGEEVRAGGPPEEKAPGDLSEASKEEEEQSGGPLNGEVRAELSDGEFEEEVQAVMARYLRGFSFSPSQTWAQWQAEQGRTPIRTIYMDRSQPKETLHRNAPYGANTPHSAEIPYLFGTLAERSGSYPQMDYDLSDVLCGYWVNFAASGDPNGEGLPPWPLYTKENPLTLHVGDDGIHAEQVVKSREEQRVLDYTKEHPGMLCSLEGF